MHGDSCSLGFLTRNPIPAYQRLPAAAEFGQHRCIDLDRVPKTLQAQILVAAVLVVVVIGPRQQDNRGIEDISVV